MRSYPIATLAALVPIVVAVLPAAAEDVGDPVMGERLAQDVCVECHAVDPGDTLSLNFAAPPFQDIANQPEITPLALSVWFRSPHPNMPNFVLSPDENQNVIAYIMSLRKPAE
jgi:mono/diheme cytochrome c family protein